MDYKFNELMEKIASQQQGKENTDVFMVGEQLKDICRHNTRASELVLSDLDVKEMSLERCAAEIKKEADRLHQEKKGSCICIPPNVAEGIIKKFYGIPDEDINPDEESPGVQTDDNIIRLEDFI